ncbi:GNAT family N-acyltransferase [Candidatus Omnitrophota bacterium]
MNVVVDPGLWNKYLDQLCKLRGKVYVDEGLYSKEILSKEGRFEEKWDPVSMHTIAVDNGRVIGGLRVSILSENGIYFDGETEYIFKKLNLKKHLRALDVMLDDFTKRKRKVIEISRLVVAEEYRRFRNVKSKVGAGLFTVTYSYFFQEGVNEVLIIQGNKYKTGRIYEKMGFTKVHDVDEKTPLEPFYEFNDICTFMHFDPSQPSQILTKFIEGMKDVYLNSTIIVKQG